MQPRPVGREQSIAKLIERGGMALRRSDGFLGEDQ